MLRIVVSWIVVVAVSVFLSTAAYAATYQPPPIQGHVTDTAGKLRANEREALNTKLADYRKCSTNHVAVFIPASLDGHSIEDASYGAFNTWKIGEGAKDNGVLLIIAPVERKSFIATGKGVGGELPDVAAFHILREKVTPRVKEDKYFQAIEDGTTAIGAALGGSCSMHASVVGEPTATAPTPTKPPEVRAPLPPELGWGARMAMFGAIVVLAFFAAWGVRAVLLARAIATLFISGFFLFVSNLFGWFGAVDTESAMTVFQIACVLLTMFNIGAWLIRWRVPVRSGPFDDSSYGGGGGSSSSTFGSSSSFDTSSSSSSSSSSFTSSSSSSSDSSYSGGGGSTGGGGAGDSW